MTGMRVVEGVANFWAKVGCVPGSERSMSWGDLPSKEVSFAHMLISSSSEMLSIFSGVRGVLWGPASSGVIIVERFSGVFGESVWLRSSERLLMDLRGRRVYFLGMKRSL